MIGRCQHVPNCGNEDSYLVAVLSLCLGSSFLAQVLFVEGGLGVVTEKHRLRFELFAAQIAN